MHKWFAAASIVYTTLNICKQRKLLFIDMEQIQISEHIYVSNKHGNVNDTISRIVNSGKQDESFYICDVNDIIQKYKVWHAVLNRVKPHYAVKCNDHLVVLKVLAALGVGFDCASQLEMQKILNLGVKPSRIIYAHTTKPSSHIKFAAEAKVNYLTFDNELELLKIKKLHANAQAIIRIRCDARVANFLLGAKFGCDPNNEAPRLLRRARSLHINVVGVSFHVGTGCQDPIAFQEAIEAAHKVFTFAATLGYHFKLLDIGGGYPGQQNCAINEFAKLINSAIEEHFSDKSIRIVAEPGTYFVDSAFTLACSIHSSKKFSSINSTTGETSTKYLYYICESVFGSFRDVIVCNIVRIPQPLKKYPKSKICLSTIRGVTNYSIDTITSDIPLPEMSLGDWFVFSNMGAYTLTIFSRSLEVPDVYNIIDRSNWELIKEEQPFKEEYFILQDTL